MSYEFETQAIRTQTDRSQHREHATPIYMTSSFVFDDAEQMRALFAREIEGNIYSRFSNPSNQELIDKVCLLEGAEAGISTATGMSAVFTALAGLCQSGDHILSSRSVFGSTHSVFNKLLPRWNITHTYADIHKTETWHELVQENTRLLYVETPSNPAVDLLDLQWLGNFAREHKLILIVDNCFASPYLQQPIQFGADLVIHSATKYIDGQGRVLGGLIVGNAGLIDELKVIARHSGPALSPFNSWILSKSLETLAVRMDRHCENALTVSMWLEEQQDVEFVKYPFLPSHPQYELARKQMKAGGGVIAFEIKGGLERGRAFLDSLQLASLTANLGDTRTIATHPASTTHARLTDEERLQVGITPGLIRISVGLEHSKDIIEDLEQAFAKTKASLKVHL